MKRASVRPRAGDSPLTLPSPQMGEGKHRVPINAPLPLWREGLGMRSGCSQDGVDEARSRFSPGAYFPCRRKRKERVYAAVEMAMSSTSGNRFSGNPAASQASSPPSKGRTRL